MKLKKKLKMSTKKKTWVQKDAEQVRTGAALVQD